MLNVIAASTPSGYRIANSLRFRSSASAYLSRAPASASNQQTWTWSAWVKRGDLTRFQTLFSAGTNANDRFVLAYDSAVAAGTAGDYLTAFAVIGGVQTNLFQTNAVFRDSSAWYHIVVAFDTTQATSTNRLKVYINGTQQTFSTYNAPTQNSNGIVNRVTLHAIASYSPSPSLYSFDGYMADINFIDGQALTPSSFGEIDATTGIWKPKQYSGTYGTNGFKLNFSNGTSTTTLGYDSSGNSNNWTTNNISLTAGSTYDWMIDSPTPYAGSSYGVGNYAVLNPIDSGKTLSNANLTYAGSTNGVVKASFGVSSGKWYWEYLASGSQCFVGLCGVTASPSSAWLGGLANGWGYYGQNGSKYSNNVSASYGASYVSGDIIGVAFDADAGTLTFYKNNVSQGVAYSGLTGSVYCPAAGNNVTSDTGSFNFGQRPFAYTPPTGYKALNTQNLPAASVVNGAAQFATTLYTGNGSTQSIVNAVNGVSFQPDFVWIKDRTSARNHKLTDSVRGATLALKSNLTDAESTDSTGLTTFNSNGFTLGSDVTYNTSGENYIAWNWKANGTAVTNNAGSISSQVSANTTAGFSVATFTCNAGGSGTFGHGLGVAPSMVIIKSRTDGIQSWIVGCNAISWNNYLFLNQTNASTALSTVWNNTAPASSVVTLGSIWTSATFGSVVAYCFAAIPGYSAFGSYTGNGSTDGPFVYCGFRPRYVLIKCSSTTDQWIIHDTARDPYNISNYILFPNLSDGGYTYDGTNTSYPFDMLSNGFKIRSTYPNSSGATYIYAAFAENPFKNSLAR